MAKHRTSEEWARILAAYSNRTGTQAEFCAEHDICQSTLQYNLRKSRQDKGGQPRRKPQPQIVELTPQTPLAPVGVADLRDTELSLQHCVLGELTVRCHHRYLSEVISQLSGNS